MTLKLPFGRELIVKVWIGHPAREQEWDEEFYLRLKEAFCLTETEKR